MEEKKYEQGFVYCISQGYCQGFAWHQLHILCPHCLEDFKEDYGFGPGDWVYCEKCNAKLKLSNFKYHCDYRKIRCANGHEMEKYMDFCYKCGIPLK